MSKPSFESMEGLEQLQDAPVYSKDYWDLVFEQLGKRSLFKVGIVILALLYGAAIYAPFLANDRPLRFEGVDIGAYQKDLRQAAPILKFMGEVANLSEEEFRANLLRMNSLGDSKRTPQTQIGQLENELGFLRDRVDRILHSLPPESTADRDSLTAMRDSTAVAVKAFEEGDHSTAKTQLQAAEVQARALRTSLRPMDPANPSAGGMDLVSRAESPLWDDLPPLDIFFMVVWAFVLTWPIWNPLINLGLGRNRDRIREWRKRKWMGVFAIAVLCALGWFLVWGGGGNINQNSGYKHGLYDGTMVAIPEGMRISQADTEFDIPWTPLRYGIAETHSEELFRPPTWLKRSRTDESGAYVPQGDSGETAGAKTSGSFTASYTPVKVRPGEPGRDSWYRHLAGVDESGRDFFSRMIWGARTSLTVGILSAFLLTIIGIFFGSLAGYFGGWVDTVIMRLIEILQSIPAFFLILLTVAFIPADVIKPIFAIVIVIALIRWTGTARLVRGEFLRLREQEFVVAARALGFSSRRTIFKHVLPNAMSPVLVSAAFAVAAGILTESAISFLGFGIKPPEASWGSLVSETKNPAYWWVQVFPGILIFITVTCYNLVGDAIRDAMDPKMKE